MPEPVERLVNLALFLADTPEPVSVERVRTEVDGYSAEQEDSAFLRMFERDKESLRDAGFSILADERGQYRLDHAATFATPVQLSPAEGAALHILGSALTADPSFPFAEDLRLALAKLSSESCAGPPIASTALADENPHLQATRASELSSAARDRKRVTFGYTNSRGTSARREVEPYGVFVYDGRWYLVGRDTALDEIRTFAAYRMNDLAANAAKPKSPDFERPAGFDVARHIVHPFQYGPAEAVFEATVRISPDVAWMAPSLTRGAGSIAEDPDAALTWSVAARSAGALARFVIEHGPGLELVAPPEAVDALRAGLGRAEVRHG